MTDVAIPIWSLFAFGGSAVLGLFALVARLLIKQSTNGKAKDRSTDTNLSCPIFDVDKLVTKEMCVQTQETVHVEMKLISQAVAHTNRTLERVEENQNEKLEQLILLLKDDRS